MERKEMFEAKARYVERRNSENMEIDILTDEQHFAIQHLCAMRHRVHTFGHKSLFLEESGDRPEMCDYLMRKMYEELEEVNLPEIDKSIEEIVMDMPTDYDWIYAMDEDDRQHYDDLLCAMNEDDRQQYDDGYDLWYEIMRDKAADMVESINDIIEEYLRSIDEEYGTHYAPTGFSRYY